MVGRAPELDVALFDRTLLAPQDPAQPSLF
jgi:hypothetical protein